MATENYKKAEEIFNNAIEIKDPAKRAAYLDDACKNNQELRAEVEALLKGHEKAGSFLDVASFDMDVTLDQSSLTEGPGTIIGRYKILEQIGEGGFGVVYMAEQTEPIHRKVALKIIKLGMDTKQVVARFEAERQTLALLEHSNIAHVFDAGTTDSGRPYFVMEYVEGKSITKYCDEYKLSVEERLKLFRQVCEGVHHAHQKGIIHRDIKPSNILVSVQDDKAVPKIIDFGIAKAITQPLTGKTSYTEQGQLLGTPEYMSPEQAEMAYQDVDTRSDIYSLGVLLYELLTGAPPFDAKRLREGGIDHIQQVICEEEPRTPSARLTSLGDKAKAVAQSRRTQIITLTRRLHRELEWIPMKAMRKNRTRRYRSASELADDIQNYLTGTPLIAGPESAVYRTRKFVRKHAGSVAMVALVAVAIVLGLVASIFMGCRAEQARKQEAAARKQVEQALVRAENAERVAQEQRRLAEKLAEDYSRVLYLNCITTAEIAYRDGRMHRVREMLDVCPEDLRGWEWYRLNHISDQAVMTLRGHDDRVYSAEFSPDGKRIFSGSGDNMLKVWDAASGVELMTLHGPDGAVGPSAFSPDGERIISSDKDGTIRIWDTATSNEVITLRGHSDDEVYAVKFSPDGKRIVSSSYDQTVRVWDGSTGAELMTLRGHEGKVGPVLFSPDGRRIVSAGLDGTVKVWDAVTGAELMTLHGHEGSVWALAFSPDGRRFVSCSQDQTARVWDAATGAELMTLRGHADQVCSVAFSPDGKRIVSGSGDSTIKVWDSATGAELMTLRGHEGWVGPVSFSPDGKRIISGGGDKTIKVWDVAIRGEVVTLSGHRDKRGNNHIFSVAFSPDSKRIVSGSLDRTVKLWDAETGAEPMTLRGHDIWVRDASFSPDGKRIVSAGGDNTVKVWDAGTGKELMTLHGHSYPVLSVAFSPDGRRIISGSFDKTVKVWDVARGNELMTLRGHKSPVQCVAISPDGKRIVSGSGDKTIKIWDAATGTELMTLRGHSDIVWSVAFSPNGKRIVSGSFDETVKVWDAEDGQAVMTLRGHSNRVRSVAFSPDGERIVSGSLDGTAKLWDSATGTELMTLRVVGNWPSSIAFSPDGKTIAAGIYDNSIKLWESATPTGGYEPRWNAEAVRKVVDELYKETGFYSEVIDKLNADKTLAEPVRKVALQIAKARLWEDARKLKEQSWEVVSLPGREIEAYRLALGKAEMANRLEPNDRSILHNLGIAQYRVGAYQDAINTLTRAEKMWKNINQPISIFAKFAFIAKAMASHKLGQYEHAEVALQRLRDLRKDELFAEDEEVQAFLTEAEKLITGEER